MWMTSSAVSFNKGTPSLPSECQGYLPTFGQKFWLDTPGIESSLQQITGKIYWDDT